MLWPPYLEAGDSLIERRLMEVRKTSKSFPKWNGVPHTYLLGNPSLLFPATAGYSLPGRSPSFVRDFLNEDQALDASHLPPRDVHVFI